MWKPSAWARSAVPKARASDPRARPKLARHRSRAAAIRHPARHLALRLVAILAASSLVLAVLLGRLARPQPNVLLITLDSLRADVLGSYGCQRDTTPNLDTFAQRCYLFTHAFGQSFYTGPSHSAMLTSLYPRSHGAFTNELALDRAHLNLAKYFRGRGYRTAAFVNVGLLGKPFHYDEGFGVFEEREGDGKMLAPASEWLAKQGSRPFFCWMHFNDAHSPYAPPPLFDQRYTAPTPPTRVLLEHDAMYAAWQAKTLTADEVQWAKDQYDADVHSLDDQLGVLLGRLQASGLLQRTIIVVVADHGEGFNLAGGRFGHGYYLYDDIVHVPLLLYVPFESWRLEETRRIDTLVQGIDLAPTLAVLTGGRIPPVFQGTSLVPLLNGTRQTLHDDLILGVGWQRQPVAVRSLRWKFINDTNQPPDELYDLEHDPGETRNLLKGDPTLAKPFEQRLRQWRGQVPEYQAAGSQPSATAEEVKQLMQRAGYLPHDRR